MRLGTVRGAVILVGYVADLPMYVLAQQESVAGCPIFFLLTLYSSGLLLTIDIQGEALPKDITGGRFLETI